MRPPPSQSRAHPLNARQRRATHLCVRPLRRREALSQAVTAAATLRFSLGMYALPVSTVVDWIKHTRDYATVRRDFMQRVPNWLIPVRALALQPLDQGPDVTRAEDAAGAWASLVSAPVGVQGYDEIVLVVNPQGWIDPGLVWPFSKVKVPIDLLSPTTVASLPPGTPDPRIQVRPAR